MENRIDVVKNKKNILSVYFTAGYPSLNDTETIIKLLEESGADMIEVGIPFSDPTADGPTIQKSTNQAIENGMSLQLLFNQLKSLRQYSNIPILLMGYFNVIYQFGVENFIENCKKTGIDGTIIPDLPLNEYNKDYKRLFEKNNIYNIFFISPETNIDRIKEIDNASKGFIYVLSASQTTGKNISESKSIETYLTHLKSLNLSNPFLVGFGISNKQSFDYVCQYANGAIIGSAFVKAIAKGNLEESIKNFVNNIKKV